jgi:hypothetical protein
MKMISVAKWSLMFSFGLLLVPMTASAQKEEPRFEIGGYIHLDYYRGDSGASDVAEQQATVRRARLDFNAKVNDQITFNIVSQFDDSGSIGERTSTLKDAIATYKLHDLATVRAGKFKYEFDLEGRESSTDRPLMNRSMVTNTVAGQMTGAGGDFRDTGLLLLGKTSLGGDVSMGYGVGFWQGVGPDAKDNNSKIGTTGNVWVSPMKGLKLNGGYMSSDNTPEGGDTSKYTAAVVGAQFERGPILARFEYYDARLEGIGPDIDRAGWYISTAYSVLPDLDLMARYQQFENESWGTTDNQISSLDLGAKYYLAKKGRRAGTNVSLNYMIRKADVGVTHKVFDERGGDVTGDDIGNIIMARLQVQL